MTFREWLTIDRIAGREIDIELSLLGLDVVSLIMRKFRIEVFTEAGLDTFKEVLDMRIREVVKKGPSYYKLKFDLEGANWVNWLGLHYIGFACSESTRSKLFNNAPPFL